MRHAILCVLLALLAVAAGSLRAPHSRRCVPRRRTLRPLLLRGGDGGDDETEDCPGGVCKMPGADDGEDEAAADADAADGAEVAATDDAAAVEEPPPPTFLQRILPNLMLIGVAIVARLIKHFFLKGRGGAAEAAAEAVEGAAEGVAAAAGEAVADAAADGAAAAATEAAAEATGLFGRFRAFISGPSAAPLMMSLLVLSTRMVSGLNKQQEAEAAAAEAPVEVEEEVAVEAAAGDEDDDASDDAEVEAANDDADELSLIHI